MNRRLRLVAMLLFLLGSGVASHFYWFRTEMTIRPERSASFANGMDWWQGMMGYRVTQHRPGIQVSYIDPLQGRIRAVWELGDDIGALRRMLGDLPADRWLVLTMLKPGLGEQLSEVSALLVQAGWEGDLLPADQGTGIFVMSRERVLAAKVSESPDLWLEMAQGLSDGKGEGKVLGRPFAIHVKEYE